MKKSKNLLEAIISESKAYETFKDIEKLIEVGKDLSMVPIQPLYMSLMNSPASELANILPRLSTEQRQSLIDLDFWNKDIVDVNSFEYWVEVYSLNKDSNLTWDFVNSDDFLLYLKSRINVWTFDAEDPLYPDHDYYFLTDDNLLLIEYSEEFRLPNELKYLIRNMYDALGVENAYSKLFKLINDSFSLIQENSYQEKKERLREFGFVDYFEAKESLFPFATYPQIKRFITKRDGATGDIDTLSKNQTLHSSALLGFNKDVENISKELGLLQDEKREAFLQFNFVRMINSSLTLSDALRKGRVELANVTKQSRQLIDLAIQYTRQTLGDSISNESIFKKFDFMDLYKIGNSLISINKNKIKRNLAKTAFEDESKEYFLGVWWNSFLNNSFLVTPKTKTFGAGLHSLEVTSLESFDFWKSESNLFCKLLPFITSFHTTALELEENSQISDSFYLNYNIKDIDFESIIISSFINYSLKHETANKMGLSIAEFKTFIDKSFIVNGDEHILKGQDQLDLTGYSEKYGFNIVGQFEDYLYGIMCEHLNGYDFMSLSEEDFAHVGGPILLDVKKSH